LIRAERLRFDDASIGVEVDVVEVACELLGDQASG